MMISPFRHRRQHGAALVEFALALAVVTPAFIGGWQFFAAYTIISEAQAAAVQGANAAAALPYDSPNHTPTLAYRRAVEDAVLRAPVHGLQREHIGVAMRFEDGRPAEVEVKISGLPLQVPGGDVLLNGRPKATYPYRGHWSASAR